VTASYGATFTRRAGGGWAVSYAFDPDYPLNVPLPIGDGSATVLGVVDGPQTAGTPAALVTLPSSATLAWVSTLPFGGPLPTPVAGGGGVVVPLLALNGSVQAVWTA
jgi:hypothetical protein